MYDELEEIKKRKMEQLKKQYMFGGKNMDKNILDKPLELTDADIDEHIHKYDTLVVDCWAPWCGPCRVIHPIIEELAIEMKGKIVFGRLNVDENQATSIKYNIMSIPSLLVFKNGKLVDVIIGAMPKQILKPKIERYK
jgi:thioredoxin 1